MHFVDHSYKSQLERFKQVQSLIENFTSENESMPHAVKNWKEDIRDLILRVRAIMIGFIDSFTSRIIK